MVSDHKQKIWSLLEQVTDPEIPVLSLIDLGVVKDVQVSEPGAVTVTVIPTYSACPATFIMQSDIVKLLAENGYQQVSVEVHNSPAWTSDNISQLGREKLKKYGIAPPQSNSSQIACPQCGSKDVECISQFGSTACKALYRCKDCLEPFDYFKCHV